MPTTSNPHPPFVLLLVFFFFFFFFHSRLMGNAISPCLRPNTSDGKVKVVFWGGITRVLSETQPAGKLMLEFPDQLVCHAGSFYLGKPVPTLSIGDDLLAGETYFVIPVDRLPCQVLTAASLALLSAGSNKKPIDFGDKPFEYVKNAGGDSVIKVSAAFLTKILNGENGARPRNNGGGGELSLCSTPELRKHYDQLVGSRTQPWSPKLETILERQKKLRLSPMRLSPMRLSPMRVMGR